MGFEELKLVVRHENEQTRDHIDKIFQQKQAQEKKENYQKQFLTSLWFTEIHSREERIADAHRETFEWIFDKSGQAVRPWDNYVQWLESGRDAYWINGKAGSGKSTLMSFLCQDARTKESLKVWSGEKEFLMPKFFFWSGGTALEKSIEGLLRSLIWQILNDLPGLDIGFPQTTAAWTERRLRTTLQKTVQLALNTHSLCFFVDGLDEFGGEQDELISFIQEAIQVTKVKVCLSSRPYRAFEKAFGSSAKLRLQDLTRKDIQRFVVDNLQGMEQASEITLQYPLWLGDVTEAILWRAEGVFLWVFLVVRDQIHGLRNGDSPEQLEERLKNLPSEVEGVYAHMLSQIEKYYRREASQLLQIALHNPQHSYDRTLLGFALASLGRLDNILGSSDNIPELELIETSHSIRERIGITCAGLLEIHDHANRGEDELFPRSFRHDLALDAGGEVTKEEILYLESYVTVDFVHRTALDFLQDPRHGGAFLIAHSPSDFDPRVSYVKVSLAKMRLFGIQCQWYADYIMYEMSRAERQTGVAQEQLCELIDVVMSTIDHTHPDWRPESHWCTRWGDLPRQLDRKEQDINSNVSPASSSASSSRDSFYSIATQPWAHNCCVKFVGRQPDFLAFAAWCGLSRYILQVLHSKKVPLETGAATCLLYCSEHSIEPTLERSEEGIMAAVTLIGECLRQGADPNMKDPLRIAPTSNVTVWSIFLENMHDCLHYDSYAHADLAELRKLFLQTTMAFIENGADLHIIITPVVDSGSSVAPRFEDKIYKRQIPIRRYYEFKVELSPLAIFELCLHDPNEITQIKEICVAKGARSYYGCINMKMLTDDLEELSVELSGQESAAFFTLFKKELTRSAAMTHFKHLSRQLGAEIYQDRKKRLS